MIVLEKYYFIYFIMYIYLEVLYQIFKLLLSECFNLIHIFLFLEFSKRAVQIQRYVDILSMVLFQ